MWSLLESDDGHLWAGTEYAHHLLELLDIDPAGSRIVHRYSAPNGIAPKVVALTQDHAGDLWLGGATDDVAPRVPRIASLG